MQVALKWVLSQSAAVVTKSLNPQHLAQDVALFDWELTPAELRALDAQTVPAAQPSFMCDG
jgi:diketogulonate reductase-like aldo/keto reductase